MNSQPTEPGLFPGTNVSIENKPGEIAAIIRERYAPVFDHSFDCIYVYDLNANFIYGNKAMMELTGYAMENVPKPNFSSFISPDQMPEAMEAMQVILKDGFDKKLRTYRIRTKKGDEAFVETRGSLILHEGKPFAIQGIARDITEQIRAEEKLKASRERFRNILDSIEDGYYEVDLAGNFTFCSHALVKIIGYSRDELLGMNNREYMDSQTAKDAYRIYHQVFQTGVPVKGYGYDLVLKGGKKLPVEVSISLMKDSDGNITGFRGILRDVTERRALEEQLGQSQKMGYLGTVTGGIAHHLNNILAIILWNVELAMDFVHDGNPSGEFLKEAAAACLRAKEQIDNLIAFSKKIQTPQQPIDLSSIVTTTLKLLGSELPSNIELRQSIKGRNHIIKGDPLQIPQIITHLISNAQKAMAGNGGIIDVLLENTTLISPEAAMVNDLKPGDYVCLTIKDTGSGIDPKAFHKIFDPYYTSREVGEGSGMGLSVVHGIMRFHEGSIQIESNLGEGTSVRLFFPSITSYVTQPNGI